MNIYEIFRERSRDAGPFILSPDLEVQFTYEDMETLSGQYANRLLELAVSPGDRVIAQVHKSPQSLFLYFACLRVGAIFLPLNTAYLDEELKHFVENAEPSVIVCDPTKETLFRSLTGAQVRTMDVLGHGSFSDGLTSNTGFVTIDRDDDDIAVMLYTSGTTGRPKGAMISHGNLATNGQALHKAWQWQTGDVMLHALPVFHVHGLMVATHLPVLNGSPIIFLTDFNPEDVTRLLPSATVYMGVPTNYTRLIGSDRLNREVCSNMRLFTSGSAPLLEPTFNNFRDLTGHEIVERYGMTETGMNTSNPLDGERKPGTVGPMLAGVTAKIIDDDGREVATDEPGNLLIKGPNVFMGYWKLPEKTKEGFTGDGYFKTGDLATRDADGYISIVGRNKDMIISGGLNVYPKEVEAAIDKINGVFESAVIGLPHDDFGEGVCAIVVCDPAVSLDETEILLQLKSRLANFKRPKWIHFEPELPRNTMGKVQKNLLREKIKS